MHNNTKIRKKTSPTIFMEHKSREYSRNKQHYTNFHGNHHKSDINVFSTSKTTIFLNKYKLQLSQSLSFTLKTNNAFFVKRTLATILVRHKLREFGRLKYHQPTFMESIPRQKKNVFLTWEATFLKKTDYANNSYWPRITKI